MNQQHGAYYWLGITDQGHRGNFTNLDGSASNYTNWGTNMPHSYNRWNVTSVVILSSDGIDASWYNTPTSAANAGGNKYNYVCKYYVGK
jgi:hypothetical protein